MKRFLVYGVLIVSLLLVVSGATQCSQESPLGIKTVTNPGTGGSNPGSTPLTNFQTFSVNEEDYGMNGHTFCNSKGYTNCVNTVNIRYYKYYESTNSTCSIIQSVDRDKLISDCDGILIRDTSVYCRYYDTVFNGIQLVEPALGDTDWTTRSELVVCAI